MKQTTNQNLKFAILATDIALFTIHEGDLYVRIISLDRPHIKEKRSLPGGLILPSETAEESARRIIREKGGIDDKKVHLEQLYTFSKIDRDPRGRVVSVAYNGYIRYEDLSEAEKSNTKESWWSKIILADKLGYDHDDILQVALSRMKARIRYTTLLSKILSKEFTLTELENSFETILGVEIDKRNFRKKISKLRLLKKLDKTKVTGAHRPAILYRFKEDDVREMEIF